MFILRNIIWCTYFVVTIILLSFPVIYLKILELLGKKEKHDRVANAVVHGWAKSLLWLCGAKVEVKGKENLLDEPVLYISNHQGDFDIITILACIDKNMGVVSKKEMQKLPVIRRLMRHFYCVFIDRGNPRKSIMAINQAVENVNNGHSMLIFPEGTRSKKREMGEFKHGSFKIALKSEVPIIPIAINGTYKLFEEKGLRLSTKNKVTLEICKPIYIKDLNEDEKKELPDKVYNLIKEKVEK